MSGCKICRGTGRVYSPGIGCNLTCECVLNARVKREWAIAAAERRVVEAAEAWATDDVSADTDSLCLRLFDAVDALRKARDPSTPESGNEEGKG